MANIIVGWEDILDEKHSNLTGEYLIYRNYKLRDENGNESFAYKLEDSGCDNDQINLFDTTPVAYGLTAYWAIGVQSRKNPSEIINPKKRSRLTIFFDSYRNKARKYASLENSKCIFPFNDEDFDKHFIPSFILREDRHLADSEKFYSECSSDEDRSEKSLLRQYIKSYIDGITEEYKLLLRSDHLLHHSCRPKSETVSHGNGSDHILPANIRFLVELDDLLSFIYQRFYEQAFPASRSFICPISGLPASVNIEYIYNLRLSSNAFDIRMIKNKIRALLMCPDINISGLFTLLKGCEYIAEAAAILFEEILCRKQFSQQFALFVTFDAHNGEFIYHNIIDEPKGFARFKNEDFYYFIENVSLFIFDIISYSNSVSGWKNDLPPGLEETNTDNGKSAKTPLGILEFKINSALTPLTVAEGISLPCIETAYKDYLVRALLAIHNGSKPTTCSNTYKIRNNTQFYMVLNSVKNEFNFETKAIVELISFSAGKAKKTVLNCLSQYKSETK